MIEVNKLGERVKLSAKGSTNKNNQISVRDFGAYFYSEKNVYSKK